MYIGNMLKVHCYPSCLGTSGESHNSVTLVWWQGCYKDMFGYRAGGRVNFEDS